MKRWVAQAYQFHFHNIPLGDISVSWVNSLNEYSCVIELQVFKDQEKTLPTIQEFIDSRQNFN